MVHLFWPRCKTEGTIQTQDGELNMSGLGMFAHANQAIKPNLAAVAWNFAQIQTPTYTAVMMEFTTPHSYGSTVVNVGGIVTDDKIIAAGGRHSAQHTISTVDAETGWPEPTSINFTWKFKTENGQDITAELAGPLGQRLDRVNVMEQVPKFLRNIIYNIARTSPYIYQFGPKLPLKITFPDKQVEEVGTVFMEATFISGERNAVA